MAVRRAKRPSRLPSFLPGDGASERGRARGGWRRRARCVALILLSGCVDTTGPPFPHIELTDFAPALGIDLDEMTRIDGGIYVLDLAVGAGDEIGRRHWAEVAYSLYLSDGTLVERRDAYRYRTACREAVPPGLETGVHGMRVGGQRRIIVPGRWGFGEEPPTGIDVPFGAILVFVVDALDTSPRLDCPGRRR